jgi:hypothetical protein
MHVRAWRLRRGEWIVGVSSVVLLVSMFALTWFDVPHSEKTQNGWDSLSHARWLLIITIAAGFVLVYVQASRSSPAIPVTTSLLVAVLGALSVLWLIYRLFISPAGDRQAGAYVGLVAAAGIAFGGFLSVRDEGIAPADAPAVPTVDPSATGGS